MKAIVILEDGQKFYTTITGGNTYNKICNFVQYILNGERENIKYKLVLE